MRVFLFWGVCMCVFVKTSLDVTSFPHVYIARRCSFVFQQQVHFLLAVQQTKKQKQKQNKTKKLKRGTEACEGYFPINGELNFLFIPYFSLCFQL